MGIGRGFKLSDRKLMLPTSCYGVNHCGNIRTCDRCAKARQKKIADAADRLEQQHGQLSLTVLVPAKNTQDEIKRLRASFLRRAVAPSGIWTVETGEKFGGLHLNILSPKPAPARWRAASTYSELVRCTAREAAAYIAKRSGMPPIEQYIGNLYGTFGQLFTLLSSGLMPPVVQAAAIEITLTGVIKMHKAPNPIDHIEYRTPEEEKIGWDEMTLVNGVPCWYSKKDKTIWTTKPPRQKHSVEVRREIMRQHLPNIYAAISKPMAEPGCARSLHTENAQEQGRAIDKTGAWPEGRE